MHLFLMRALRALRLDPQLYAEVAQDEATKGHAMWMVALFAMVSAFGLFSRGGPAAVNSGLVTAVVGWYLWAFTAAFAAKRMLAPNADKAALLRVVAFACAPGLLRLLGVIPQFTFVVLVGTSIWMITAAVIGLRAALQTNATGLLTGICIGAWILATVSQAMILVLLYSIFGISGAAS